jgi:hypothetical protein
MPVAVNAPQKRDPLQRISNLLSIGQSVMGIKSDIEQSKLRTLQEQNMQEEKATQERLSNNIYTTGEASKLHKIPADSTDVDAVDAVERIKTRDPSTGQEIIKESPFKFIPKERLEYRKESIVLDNMRNQSDRYKNGVYMPDEVADKFIIRDKSDRTAIPIKMRLNTENGVVDKQIFVVPKSTYMMENPRPNLSAGISKDRFIRDDINKFRSEFQSQVAPIVSNLNEIDNDQDTINAASQGKISWGAVEGLLATKVASRAQKGQMTDRDFERASFSSTDIIGKSKQEINKWMGSQTDRARALRWLNNAMRKSYERDYEDIRSRQANQVSEWNMRYGPDYGTIKEAEVVPMLPRKGKGKIFKKDNEQKKVDLKQSEESAMDDVLGGN